MHAAQMRTLEMILSRASLTEVLNQLCVAIDSQVAPSKTVILLIDPDGKRLWPTAGPEISPDWMRAISPLPVAPEIGLCGTAACLKTPVIVQGVSLVNNMQRRGQPILVNPGKTVWDNNLPAGVRYYTIYDSTQRILLRDRPVRVQTTDQFFGIRPNMGPAGQVKIDSEPVPMPMQ